MSLEGFLEALALRARAGLVPPACPRCGSHRLGYHGAQDAFSCRWCGAIASGQAARDKGIEQAEARLTEWTP